MNFLAPNNFPCQDSTRFDEGGRRRFIKVRHEYPFQLYYIEMMSYTTILFGMMRLVGRPGLWATSCGNHVGGSELGPSACIVCIWVLMAGILPGLGDLVLALGCETSMTKAERKRSWVKISCVFLLYLWRNLCQLIQNSFTLLFLFGFLASEAEGLWDGGRGLPAR